MDNKVFNVSGRSKEQLHKTLECLLFDEYGDYRKVKAWKFDKEKGLILYWHENAKGSSRMMGNLNPEQLTENIWQWLETDEAKTTTLNGFDVDTDHDGSNELGFRVYVEEWGSIERHQSSICAITPRYCWYGK